jgi:magnesium-transporting ATPase (P-type)
MQCQTQESNAAGQPWHMLTAEEALASTRSTAEGLGGDEARERLQRYGPNVIQRASGNGPLRILWRQINNPLIWVLLASAGLAIVLNKVVDGFVIFTVVVVNTIIGFIQEFRAGRAIEALIDLVPEYATVLRDGRRVMLPVSEIVPGDIVMLSAGDKVPADMRLLSVRNLRAEEAALTGESVPVQKSVEPVALNAAVGDRRNMVFGGTLVTYGTGVGLVVATGSETELGRISSLLREAADLQTPLTRSLAVVGKYLTVAILAVSAVLLTVGLLRGYPLADALLVAVTLAVAAIPEGLPAIVTIALAIGVQRMAARKAIIRKLPAVETLGSTTVICSDKTGTLTRNEMTVQELWTPFGAVCVSGVGYEPKGELARGGVTLQAIPADVRALLEAAVLCNDASLHQEQGAWKINGDPTEGALVVVAEKAGIAVEEVRKSYPRLDTLPFESENQFMATLHDGADGVRSILIKGAPEVILRRCSLPDHVTAADVLAAVEHCAAKGMRVLAAGSKVAAAAQCSLALHDVQSGFTLLGLQGMIDPPRPEAIAAVKACQAAGITVKMITGDHQGTAQAIGAELGILTNTTVVTGSQLSELTDTQLQEVAISTNVFARVAPEHKLRLVRALQAQNQVVAMTGDGVNDAPALKQANIGVAMGITGTAVSKEAADIVLTDDNFASIAAAVEEGRRVYDNLIKSLAFVLPTNLGLAFILLFAVLFFPIQEIAGAWVPLMAMLPTQLLWINLVATVALALPLAFEAKEPHIMRRSPRRPDEPLLGPFVIQRTVIVALLMSVGAIGLFQWEYAAKVGRFGHDIALREAQTMAVTTVIMFQIFYVLNCRSLRDSIFRIGVFSNPSVFLGIGMLIILQLGFIYLPFMHTVFGSASLDLYAFCISTTVGAVILPVISLEKWVRGQRATAVPCRQSPEPPLTSQDGLVCAGITSFPRKHVLSEVEGRESSPRQWHL